MQLVEQHIIIRNHEFYQECDSLCFKTKNLYNSCLYVIKEAYKNDKTNLLYDLHSLMKDSEQYKELPAKVSSTVLLMVQKNFKSYFKANAELYKNSSKFKGRPQLPSYLPSINGRYFASYTNQAISKKIFNKTHKISLSKTNIELSTKIVDFKDINCVRIIPRLDQYVIEIVYSIPDVKPLLDNNCYMGIDLGVNNLAALTSNNINFKPIIINGKPLKSMNQFYNKKLAHYKSKLELINKRKSSKRLNKLTNKRKNKVDNYLHKASKTIVGLAKVNNLNTIVIGKNDNWKQGVSMTKSNNQNFVNIPHSRFIDMIRYKCEIEGINVILQEESYTSKASFLNLDNIPIYGDNQVKKFSGYRYSRGIYKLRGKKEFINADVNGSYNILRKAIPNAFANGIEGIGVCPKVVLL